MSNNPANPEAEAEKEIKDSSKNRRIIQFDWYALVLFVLSIGIIVLLIYLVIYSADEFKSTLFSVILVVGGVLVLLIALTTMAKAFAESQLANPNQALGLPEGSIRAVIALSLIIVFVIGTILLYTTLSNPQTANLQNVSEEQITAIPISNLLSKTLSTVTPPKYNVEVIIPSSQASVDFAKQVLTVISTLVVSITSFYFGTRSAETALGAKTASLQPIIDGIDPQLGYQRQQPLDVTIRGRNLQLVNSVIFSQGTTYKLVADDPRSNETSITTRLKITGDSPLGLYDVSVSTTDGMQATKEKGFTISTPPTPPVKPDTPVTPVTPV